MELKFSRNNKYCSLFGNISEVKRRTLIATHHKGMSYLNGLDQGGCVVLRDGLLLKSNLIFSNGIKPVDLLLIEFMKKAKIRGFDFKASKNVLEVVSLLDKIEFELNMEN